MGLFRAQNAHTSRVGRSGVRLTLAASGSQRNIAECLQVGSGRRRAGEPVGRGWAAMWALMCPVGGPPRRAGRPSVRRGSSSPASAGGGRSAPRRSRPARPGHGRSGRCLWQVLAHSPLVFSLLPRCHGECGSQKSTGTPVCSVNRACAANSPLIPGQLLTRCAGRSRIRSSAVGDMLGSGPRRRRTAHNGCGALPASRPPSGHPPTIRSPSHWPGTRRSSASGGRSAMGTITDKPAA